MLAQEDAGVGSYGEGLSTLAFGEWSICSTLTKPNSLSERVSIPASCDTHLGGSSRTWLPVTESLTEAEFPEAQTWKTDLTQNLQSVHHMSGFLPNSFNP